MPGDVVLQTVVGADEVDQVTGRAWVAGVTGIAEEALDDGTVRISVGCPVDAQAAVTLALGGSVESVGSWTVVVKRVAVDVDGVELVFEVPANVFGDGSHPTTASCLAVATELVREGDRVLDLGCGSGILSVAAARRGGSVVALDLWAPAVDATRANAERHEVADRVGAVVGSIDSVGGSFEVVFANIGAATLVELSGPIRERSGGILVLSGVLERQADEVAAGYGTFTELRRLVDDGWATLVLGSAT